MSPPSALHRLASATALCIAASAAPAAVVTHTVASVDDMQAGEWTQQVLRATGPGGVALSVRPDGGNGGSFWLHELTRPQGFGDSSHAVANLFDGASWNPATQGAVESIEFMLDGRGLLSTGIGIAVTGFLRPVIEQGGTVFSVAGSSTQVNVGAAWHTIERLFADTDNWIDLTGTPGVRPDFSAAGGTVRFGYRYEIGLTCPTFNNTVGCSAVLAQLGVDNFRVAVGTDVAVSAVPEPPALALAALALGLAGWTRHRSRR